MRLNQKNKGKIDDYWARNAANRNTNFGFLQIITIIGIPNPPMIEKTMPTKKAFLCRKGA
jgi:hypothetical protein